MPRGTEHPWSLRTVESDPCDLESAREIFSEYHAWLGEVVCSRSMAREIASLPGPYSPPGGRLILARGADGTAVGAVGVRPHDADACEIKRLYVRPAARGGGLGRLLAEAAVDAAEGLGYARVRVTTIPGLMADAVAIYEDMGFSDVPPFFDHSHVDESAGLRYLERTIAPRTGRS